MVAAAIVPVPGTQVPLVQIAAPVGTLPSPTPLPPEFKNAEEGTNSYMKTGARTDHRLLVAEDIPGETHPRRPIAVIGIIG